MLRSILVQQQLLLVLEEYVCIVLTVSHRLDSSYLVRLLLLRLLLRLKKLIELIVKLHDISIAILGRFLRVS